MSSSTTTASSTLPRFRSRAGPISRTSSGSKCVVGPPLSRTYAHVGSRRDRTRALARSSPPPNATTQTLATDTSRRTNRNRTARPALATAAWRSTSSLNSVANRSTANTRSTAAQTRSRSSTVAVPAGLDRSSSRAVTSRCRRWGGRRRRRTLRRRGR